MEGREKRGNFTSSVDVKKRQQCHLRVAPSEPLPQIQGPNVKQDALGNRSTPNIIRTVHILRCEGSFHPIIFHANAEGEASGASCRVSLERSDMKNGWVGTSFGPGTFIDMNTLGRSHYPPLQISTPPLPPLRTTSPRDFLTSLRGLVETRRKRVGYSWGCRIGTIADRSDLMRGQVLFDHESPVGDTPY